MVKPLEWKCLICEESMGAGFTEYGKACYPNIEGGTIEIDFGFGSKYDDLNINTDGRKIWQTCICDKCFEKKKHLCRHVRVMPSLDNWKRVGEDENV